MYTFQYDLRLLIAIIVKGSIFRSTRKNEGPFPNRFFEISAFTNLMGEPEILQAYLNLKRSQIPNKSHRLVTIYFTVYTQFTENKYRKVCTKKAQMMFKNAIFLELNVK